MNRRYVLWIEDDSFQFGPVIRLLSKEGIDTFMAASLSAAEQKIRTAETPPAVLIIDNVVADGRDVAPAANGEENGTRFAREIAERGLFQGTVLLLTFFPPSDEMIAGLRKHVREVQYVHKHHVELKELVRRICDLVRSTDQQSP